MRVLIFLLILLNPLHSFSYYKNQIAVIINNEVVTTFDIRREIFFDRVQKGLNWNQEISDNEVKGYISNLVEKWLVAQEGVKFNVTEVTPEDLINEMTKFKAKFKSPSEYESFLNTSQFSALDLERLLTRELQSAEFLKIKLPSLEPQPTNEEIESYYWSHATKYKGKKIADVKDEIVSELKLSLKERAFRRWILDLRARANLVYVIK